MFFCIPKVNFIINFFLEIHFKESCNLIFWQHFGPYFKTQNFIKCGIGAEISITILVFNGKIFQISQKLYFVLFLPKFGTWIFLKKCGIGAEISITILVFILDYFQEKLKTKSFKYPKNHILRPFCPNLGNEFSWKKGSVSFEIFQ